MLENLLNPQSLVYVAGGFYVTGLLTINQVALRLLVLSGTGFYLLYYATVAAAPLWEAIYISLLIGAANLLGLFGLLARRSRWALPRAHRDIYDHFPDLPPGDFRTLMRHARRLEAARDITLTREGMPVDNLYYVLTGHTRITKRRDSFEVPSGVFVGEVAYLTGQHASATTTLVAGSTYLQWSADDLRRTAAKSTRFRLALAAVLSLDMARKVSLSVAPNEPAWRPRDATVPDQPSSFSTP